MEKRYLSFSVVAATENIFPIILVILLILSRAREIHGVWPTPVLPLGTSVSEVFRAQLVRHGWR